MTREPPNENGTLLSVRNRPRGQLPQTDANNATLSSAPAKPPVFVMNPYYSGVGIARSLQGYGVAVFALTSEPNAPGARSRHFNDVLVVPNGRDEPEQLCQRLLEIAADYVHGPKPIIFPTRDFDIVFLHEYREALEPHFLLPQPGDSSIIRMMDKYELAMVAGPARYRDTEDCELRLCGGHRAPGSQPYGSH